MANILILGGGFGGVIATEHLAKSLSPEHQITLVSRSRRFTFYPALVRLAFGKCEEEDISYDLPAAMLARRVRFIEAEVTHVDPYARKASLRGDDINGDIKYDYLVGAEVRRGRARLPRRTRRPRLVPRSASRSPRLRDGLRPRAPARRAGRQRAHHDH